ncbi:hypothetical protein I553_3550 [Mycobacterium xenopi 4042]|uniref:Uncharacterized protein n=1 Tax=Mycobacterium xenopi 4042 TaxID=1299334 RepID=X8AN25_MYCXE|nr:hypothetical protein I553_3550 [Mycobacterium xenopi 4042]
MASVCRRVRVRILTHLEQLGRPLAALRVLWKNVPTVVIV